MKPSLENFDRPETETQQFKDHEFADNNDSKKATSKMRRKLALLIMVAMALGAFLMTACDEGPEPCYSCPPVVVVDPPFLPADSIVVRSINPTYGAPGEVVTIVLENFTGLRAEPHVTFGSSFAEVVYARWGMLRVRVPQDLQEGSYTVNVRFHGNMVSAPTAFKVTQPQN